MADKSITDILRETLVMVLAGGQGERLYPLTKDRAKPAVPFAGTYRIIDFTLSNCLHSGLRKVHVLTQYKSDSLDRHIKLGWNIFNPELGEWIETRPPQLRMSGDWYLGTAHAIYENIYTLEHVRPRHVLILSGDHVYRMDYSLMLARHVETGADLTVACVERPLKEAAGRLGVIGVDPDLRAVRFQEKPAEPEPMTGRDDACLCSMGIYAFETDRLVRQVIDDAKRGGTHDFARDVVPAMIAAGDRVFAYLFPGGYWRDIGTLDVYWEAHMDLLGPEPPLDLSDQRWPIRGRSFSDPPAMVRAAGPGPDAPESRVRNSLICRGAVICGADVSDSIIGACVRVGAGSRIEQSLILDGTCVGRNVVIRKAIVDKSNVIPDGARIGVDHGWDHRHFAVSDGGVVVVPKAMPFPAF